MALLNRLTYAQRLFVWLIVYSCLLGGCLVVFQYFRERQYKADELNAALQVVNAHILEALASGIEIDFTNEYPIDGLRVSIIDSVGNIIYDNSLDSLPHTDHRQRDEIAAAIATGEGYSVRRISDTTGSPYFYSAKKGGNHIVRTAVPYSVTLQELLTADMTFIWVMFAVLGVMCVIGYFATRRIGQHIRRLNDFARRAERGDRIYDTSSFPHDELGDISSHIVRLYARLQEAIADRDREHMAALHEQQEKVRIKRQLTNNINHELKTPLASMRVCLETLLAHENMSSDKRIEFLERCYANSERLRRLLEDVALITRMEEGCMMISKENIDLSEVISEVCDNMEAIAADRGISIVNNVNGTLNMSGNRSLLASVFYNLIDNAITYSGGQRIEIKLKETDRQRLTVILFDDGCGVADEHLKHIFERFYRVDKGRSRSHGGTGLGLSIVKNAVMLHNGAIESENRRGGGLQFTISFSRT